MVVRRQRIARALVDEVDLVAVDAELAANVHHLRWTPPSFSRWTRNQALTHRRREEITRLRRGQKAGRAFRRRLRRAGRDGGGTALVLLWAVAGQRRRHDSDQAGGAARRDHLPR